MSQPNPASATNAPLKRVRIGLVRRLAIMLYDGLLCLAVVFIATVLLMPFTDGEAIGSGSLWFQFYVLAVCFVYFGWFWTHGGQTLGMKAWRTRLCSANGRRSITWPQAMLRYMSALVSWLPAGLGFVWVLISRENLAWHDSWSESHLLFEPPSGQTPHQEHGQPQKD